MPEFIAWTTWAVLLAALSIRAIRNDRRRRARRGCSRPGPVPINKTNGSSMDSGMIADREGEARAPCPACEGTAGIADDPDGACELCAGRGTA